MEVLGHTSWQRQTVGQVEKAERNLTVDEFVSLALALDCTVSALLSPWPLLSGDWPDDQEWQPKVDLGLNNPMPYKPYTGVLGFDPRETYKVPRAKTDWRDPHDPDFWTVSVIAREPEQEEATE